MVNKNIPFFYLYEVIFIFLFLVFVSFPFSSNRTVVFEAVALRSAEKAYFAAVDELANLVGLQRKVRRKIFKKWIFAHARGVDIDNIYFLHLNLNSSI